MYSWRVMTPLGFKSLFYFSFANLKSRYIFFYVGIFCIIYTTKCIRKEKQLSLWLVFLFLQLTKHFSGDMKKKIIKGEKNHWGDGIVWKMFYIPQKWLQSRCKWNNNKQKKKMRLIKRNDENCCVVRKLFDLLLY